MTNIVFDRPEVTADLVKMVSEMIQDWEVTFEGPIDENTNLITDLDCTSLDLMMLFGLIHRHYGKKRIPFEKLFLSREKAVQNATISALATFISDYLTLSD